MPSRFSIVFVCLALASTTARPARGEDEPASPAEQNDADNARLRARIQQLEKRLSEIERAREEEELEKLRQAAQTEAAAAPEESRELGERTYITASRSLQALNPEISLSGDFLAQLVLDEDFTGYAGADDRSGLPMRALDVHVQSTLDPFSFTKLALGFGPAEGVSLEELYITWTGIIPRCTLTVGRFRHQFGVLNRWHQHDLDQTDYPLPMLALLGEDGLYGNGFSFGWLMPSLWAHANELVIQVTDGENAHLFTGDAFSVPTVMVHLKNYYDLSEATYLELGLTGMFGFNNRRGVADPDVPGVLLDDDDWRPTWVAGADLTLFWSPPRQARYKSLTWRSEGYFTSREDPGGTQRGWGIYSYLQYQLGASWYVGLRGDLVGGDVLLAEPVPGQDPGIRSLDPATRWQVVPYVTFWQSEFVYLRLEAQHGERFMDVGGVPTLRHDTRVLFQVNWAAGPHKHEKY